jgi:hypothetical protein
MIGTVNQYHLLAMHRSDTENLKKKAVATTRMRGGQKINANAKERFSLISETRPGNSLFIFSKNGYVLAERAV